ncbi:hypothetical protein CR513_52807, partial [Mucuna pruriens]
MPTYAKFMKDLLTKKESYWERSMRFGSNHQFDATFYAKQSWEGNLKLTRMTLQLVDRFIRHRQDMEEDVEVPLILEKLFLSIA